MSRNRMRATAAAMALAPMIFVGSGVAAAAPGDIVAPVQAAAPVQVAPAELGPFGLGWVCAGPLALPVFGWFFGGICMA